MGAIGRKTIATAVTVAMHATLFLGAFTFVPAPLDIELDLEFDMVEVELIDPNMIQGEDPNAEVPETPPEPEPAQPEPEPEPVPEPEPEKPPEPEPAPEDEGPVRDLGKKRSRVNKLGPASSNYHVLLSTRNIRKLPFADKAMSTIQALPDFVYLVDRGGFDAVKDFDHVLIASADLRMLTQTFLAVDYRISREAVKAKIETAVKASDETIEWKDTDGTLSGNPVPADGTPDRDPRHFVLLADKKLAVLVRPEFLPAILDDEVGEEKTQANLVSELTKLRRYSRRIPTAGLQFVANDLHAALRRAEWGGFELPNDIEFTMEARKEPEFHVRFEFASVVASKRFMTFWNGQFRDFIDGNIPTKIMIGGIVDDFELERKNKVVEIWGELEQDQLELILVTAASLVEKHQKKVERRAAKRRKKQEAKAAKEAAERGETPAEPTP